MSLLSITLSFFVAHACSGLGFGQGRCTLHYSLLLAAGAISAVRAFGGCSRRCGFFI